MSIILSHVNPELTIAEDVALIGSSAILLEKKYGKLIDSYGTVVRFNRSPVVGYETIAGSKTTIRVANHHVFSNVSAAADGRFTNTDVTHPPNFIKDQKNINIIHANDNILGWHDRDRHIDPTSNAFLMDKSNINGIPTVGFRTIQLFIANNIVPHLFGFGIHENDAATHYWENRDTNSVCHNYSWEREQIKDLLTKEKIKVFT